MSELFNGARPLLPVSERDALRVTPDMANKPFKLYKHAGGLIEDIFKAPLI